MPVSRGPIDIFISLSSALEKRPSRTGDVSAPVASADENRPVRRPGAVMRRSELAKNSGAAGIAGPGDPTDASADMNRPALP